MKRVATLLILTLLMAGCSKASSPTDPTPTATAPDQITSTPTASPTPQANKQSPSTAPTQTTGGSSSATPSPTATSSMPLVIEYALGNAKSKVWAPSFRLCVTRGQKIAITLKTAPNARIFLIAAYSDGDPHGSHEFGDASPGGTYEWDWVVPPEAPTGDGTFVATASAHESTNQHRPFKVARSC